MEVGKPWKGRDGGEQESLCSETVGPEWPVQGRATGSRLGLPPGQPASPFAPLLTAPVLYGKVASVKLNSSGVRSVSRN